MIERSNIVSLFADSSEPQMPLGDLIATVVEPVIAQTLRAALRVTLRNDDCSRLNQEALEIAGDVKLQILKEIGRMRSDLDRPPIKDLRAYVHAMTVNAYRQHLRNRHPARRQLVSKLRYVLRKHPGFRIWEEAGIRYCGAGAAARARTALSREEIEWKIGNRATVSGCDRPEKIIDLLRLIFATASGSMTFTDVVELTAKIQKLNEPIEIDTDSVTELASPGDIGSELELRESLKLVWCEIGNLSRNHRIALLMNLRDRKGTGALGFFPILGIAPVRKIADALGFDHSEFAQIWAELPWDDLKIAEYLGLTRQQVINLRQSARARIARNTRDKSNLGQEKSSD